MVAPSVRSLALIVGNRMSNLIVLPAKISGSCNDYFGREGVGLRTVRRACIVACAEAATTADSWALEGTIERRLFNSSSSVAIRWCRVFMGADSSCRDSWIAYSRFESSSIRKGGTPVTAQSFGL